MGFEEHLTTFAGLPVFDSPIDDEDDIAAGQPLTHLKRLDLHHNFTSQAMRDRLREALPGVEIDVSDIQEPHSWEDGDGAIRDTRYIAVAE